MRMCQEHWDKLRQEVKKAGLESLIAETGEEAALKFAGMANEGPTVDNFEPLIYAHMMIVQQCIVIGDTATLQSDGCPICILKRTPCPKCNTPHEDFFEEWIIYSVEDTVAQWKDFKETL